MITVLDASNCLTGGGLTYLIELLRAFDSEKHEIEKLIVWGSQDTTERLPKNNGIEYRNHPWLERNYFWRILWQKFVLEKECKAANCDILFVPGSSYTGQFKPFVTMHRNSLPFNKKERARFGFSLTRLRYHILESLQARTFKRARSTIYLTEFAKRLVGEKVGNSQSSCPVIAHGVATRFSKDPKKQLPLETYSLDAPYRFLYVSIVNFYKHQWNVVEAVAALRKQGIPVQLDLVGPAYEPALVRLLESLDKHDPEREFITYHGKIPYDELAEVYERADAFIWASSCEAFGMILIEAMSAGLPTACSSMSCMPELFEDCGWYFSPENVKSLAVALEEMISNPRTREHKAQSGVKRANCFSWQKCADQTFQHLVEVANS